MYNIHEFFTGAVLFFLVAGAILVGDFLFGDPDRVDLLISLGFILLYLLYLVYLYIRGGRLIALVESDPKRLPALRSLSYIAPLSSTSSIISFMVMSNSSTMDSWRAIAVLVLISSSIAAVCLPLYLVVKHKEKEESPLAFRLAVLFIAFITYLFAYYSLIDLREGPAFYKGECVVWADKLEFIQEVEEGSISITLEEAKDLGWEKQRPGPVSCDSELEVWYLGGMGELLEYSRVEVE